MFFKLFILFTVIPIAELYLLIKIGGMVGALNTVLIIFFTAVIGAYLAKTQLRQADGEFMDIST